MPSLQRTRGHSAVLRVDIMNSEPLCSCGMHAVLDPHEDSMRKADAHLKPLLGKLVHPTSEGCGTALQKLGLLCGGH